MSGSFDMKQFMDGYYDDNLFYNNPIDYLPGSNNWALWQMNIILGTGDHDICRGYNIDLFKYYETQKHEPLVRYKAKTLTTIGRCGKRCFRIIYLRLDSE